jgi:hydroxyethylthiazole kinase-like uncharacterized protein yjeF
MAIEIDATLLKQWPLPALVSDGDKETRGHVLIIAGSSEIPGAAVLAGVAALHAGAGKLTLATVASIAPLVAQSVPEARVIELPEHSNDQRATTDWLPKGVDAILIGPGMQDDENLAAIVQAAFTCYASQTFILDAAAMRLAIELRPAQKVLVTPHAGEMAALLDCEKSYVLKHAHKVALQAAEKWQIAVALKGAETYLALQDQRLWLHRGGDIGLATSGSGDVLAGLMIGLLAQGAAIEQAAAWGIALHALAGKAAAREIGYSTGYLARELSRHVPRIRAELSCR